MQPDRQAIHVVRFADVVSTNLIALEYGELGAAHGTVIAAVQQSGGRGRLNRSFFSPPGGLYFSLILRPDMFSENQSLLTLAAGVVCCRILEEISGLAVMLKWPNDLYLQNRKLGGILSETAPCSPGAKKIPFLVVGIGLNVNTRAELFPRPLQDKIISLYSLQQVEYDLDRLMTEIAGQINHYVRCPESMHDEILAAWRQRDYLYGRHICWLAGKDKYICGTGTGLLADGRYSLQTAKGDMVPILGGELRITDTGTAKVS